MSSGERPVGSRTGRSPAAVGGPGGVLELTGGEPEHLAVGDRSRGSATRLFGSVPSSGFSGAGSAAGCSHPFACPGRGRGRMGGSASEGAVRRGQSRGRPRCRVRAAGQTQDATSRLAAGQEELFMPPAQAAGSPAGGGRSGQAADLPVAQAVEDQGEQPPGGGDLGDVAGFLPAAGDDARLDRAGYRVCGARWIASISAQRSIGEPCLVTWPRATLVSDSRCRGVSPAYEPSWPACGTCGRRRSRR